MGISIMIVDDDVDDIELFLEAVHIVGPSISCISAQNGIEGIRLANGPAKPDYIFVDMNMPKLNGRQFIEEIRKNSRFDDTKLILYSTCKLESDGLYSKCPGADACLTKPTSLEELCEEISKIIFSRDFITR